MLDLSKQLIVKVQELQVQELQVQKVQELQAEGDHQDDSAGSIG